MTTCVVSSIMRWGAFFKGSGGFSTATLLEIIFRIVRLKAKTSTPQYLGFLECPILELDPRFLHFEGLRASTLFKYRIFCKIHSTNPSQLCVADSIVELFENEHSFKICTLLSSSISTKKKISLNSMGFVNINNYHEGCL